MAVDRTEYQVAIKTTADTAPIKLSEDAIAQLTGKVKQADAAAQAAETTHINLADAIKKGGEHAKEAGLSHRELHEGIHLAGLAAADSLGPIGELAHFIANPYTAAIFGAIEATKLLIEQRQADRENTIAQIKASTELRDIFAENLRTAILHSQEALAAFDDTMMRVGDNQDRLGDRLKQNLDLLNATAASVKSLTTAEEELNQARVEGARLAGMITDPMANFADEQLRRQARAQQQQTEHEQGAATIAAKRGAAGEYQAESDANKSAADQAMRDKVARDAALADANTMLSNAKRDMPALQQALADARTNPALNSNLPSEALAQADPTGAAATQRARVLEAQRAYQRADEAVKREKAVMDAQQETISRLTTEANLHDKDIEGLTQKAEHYKELAEQMRHAADEAERLQRATESGQAGLNATQDETARVRRMNALRAKHNAGTLTREEAVEYAGETAVPTRDPFSRNPNNAQGHMQDLISSYQHRIADIQTNVRFREGGHASPDEVAKLVELTDFLIGLMANQGAQQGRFQDQIEQLISRANNLEQM
ncbi:MAG TPA: hypothetical protein VGR14_17430, partial [Verrucomicrobiae bacterium]|nr:hypothetical protein [Verrucomicrobiae bacterium]